ncbi:MAG: HlyD family efflux transporter periplasmic adaptor subunit [Myxococcales bacterium]|nr:HlyD family efflux transporter periplasmic adaptor subunit [Myxococcales bacterium]
MANKKLARNIGRWIRRTIVVAAAATTIGLIVYAYLPKPVPAETTRVARGPLRVTVDATGKARVKDRYVVSAPLAGNLARIGLRAGDPIEAGHVLATIVPSEPPLLDERTKSGAEARVLAADAQRKQSESLLDAARLAEKQSREDAAKAETLGKDGAVSREVVERADYDQRVKKAQLASAELAVRIAAHDLAMARSALSRIGDKKSVSDKFEVTAPARGRVLRVLSESAGPVAPGTPLIEIGDPEELEVAVDVLTSDAVKIEPGARATIDRWGGAILDARVRVIEPSAFTRLSALGVEEQRVHVVLDIQNPASAYGRLGDGFRVESKVLVSEKLDAVTIPLGAAFKSGADWAAYVVVGGRAELRTIQIGERDAASVEVREGLEEGAEVLVHPSEKIKPGVEIARRAL